MTQSDIVAATIARGWGIGIRHAGCKIHYFKSSGDPLADG